VDADRKLRSEVILKNALEPTKQATRERGHLGQAIKNNVSVVMSRKYLE
jgi:hypothetical protein